MVKISFHTFGCRLNQAESSILKQDLAQHGFDLVPADEAADIVVIHSCTVTERGDADTRRAVQRVRRKNAGARIAVIGCQAQTQGEKLLKMEGVHWVVGNAVKMDLADILSQPAPQPVLYAPPILERSFTLPAPGISADRTRANLKIQDGCDYHCSYCEIPHARGGPRSREFSDLLHGASELVNAGHKELVLTGINIGCYRSDGKSLLQVIESLEGLPGLERIRLSSIEATTLPEGLFEKMIPAGKLCRYLHMPLQSGDDAILKAMNRRYRASDFFEIVRRARKENADLCAGCDVIVGFPGEDEASFERTRRFLAGGLFDYLHVFSYSDRDHGRSRTLPGKVERGVILARSRILRDLSARLRDDFFNRYAGRTLEVLIEGRKNGMWSGLTDNYIRVILDSRRELRNRIVPVTLTGRVKGGMRGILA